MQRIIPGIGVGKIPQTLLLTPLGIISRMGFIAVLLWLFGRTWFGRKDATSASM